MNHAVRTFLAMLEVEKINQLAFAQRCGLSHSTITRFVQGRAPTPELLAHLCSKWQDPNHGIELLRAHLLDEVERAGRGVHELRIELSATIGDEALERALEILGRECLLDHELRATMLTMAAMIERHRQRGYESLRAVAEDQAPFSSSPSVDALVAAEEKRRAKTPVVGGKPKPIGNGAAGHSSKA